MPKKCYNKHFEYYDIQLLQNNEINTFYVRMENVMYHEMGTITMVLYIMFLLVIILVLLPSQQIVEIQYLLSMSPI